VSTLAYDSFIHAKNIPGTDPLVPIKIRLEKNDLNSYPESYIPGDLVTWMLPGNLPHIGIVTNEYSSTSKNPMIVHNIGRGPELEDMLFDYKITGHYRYLPEEN
jgi:hypothetical protein